MRTRTITSPLALGSGAVPLRRHGMQPETAGVLVGLVALGGFAMAATAADLAGRLLWGGIGLVLSGAVVGGLPWARSLRGQHVRFESAAEYSRFVAAPHVRWFELWFGVLAMFPGSVSLAFALTGTSLGVGLGRYGPYVLGSFGLWAVVRQLRWLRTPPGLTLTPERLIGVRGAAHVDIAWDDLVGVAVIDHRGAKLVLDFASGAAAEIEPRWTGSDPNVLAAIVEHYRSNPADRHLLTDPIAAIRRVEPAPAPTPPR